MYELTRRLLVADMEAFLRVPKVPYKTWLGLDTDIKAALLVAAKRIKIEDAIMLAQAMRGREGIAALLGEVDGGQAWCELVTSRALDAYSLKKRTA